MTHTFWYKVNFNIASIIMTHHLKHHQLSLRRSLHWTSAKHCNECTQHWVGLCHEGPALLATTFPSFAIINIFATKVFTLVVIWTDYFWVDCNSNWNSTWIFVLCQVCQTILPKVCSYPPNFKNKTCDMFIIRAWNGIRMENSKFYIQPWILNIQIHSLLNDHFNIT